MDLNQHVTAMQEQLIACLQENLRIPSVQGDAAPDAPYGIEVKQSLDHVLKSAQALGFRTENVDNHLGWCEYGEGEDMIAVLGHLDVVPAGDGWTVDPYGASVSDGKIWAGAPPMTRVPPLPPCLLWLPCGIPACPSPSGSACSSAATRKPAPPM